MSDAVAIPLLSGGTLPVRAGMQAVLIRACANCGSPMVANGKALARCPGCDLPAPEPDVVRTMIDVRDLTLSQRALDALVPWRANLFLSAGDLLRRLARKIGGL